MATKKKAAGITLIGVDHISPHPKNPRKDIGDITELADSIKASGILQNLTVVPAATEGEYTVLIGHRRLAAAKLAGLQEVPCSIVDMDEKEQIATMLLENIQRADLTAYEQAQGFQMMLDLGETEAGIAEKTGFSKTTVKHRIKLLELDPEEFKKSQERQPKMADYIELEKISDPKEKNKALKSIGTDNFKWAVQSAVRAEKESAAKSAWTALVKKFKLKKAEDSLIWKGENILSVHLGFKPDDAMIKRITDNVEKGKAKYYAFRSGWVYILGDKPKGRKSVKSAKEKALEEKIKHINELEQQAKELRETFVKNYTGGHEDIIVRAAIEAQASLYAWGDRDSKMKEYLGIKEGEVKESERYTYLMKRHPEIVLLVYLALNYEGDKYRIKLVDSSGKHQKNEPLEKWYETLTNLGYRISDEESRLLDGSHECFKEDAE